MVAFRWTENSLRAADLCTEERVQCLRAQHGAVDNLALENREGFLKNGGFAIRGDQLNPQFIVVLKNRRLLVVPEIVRLHRRHVGLGVLAPFTHCVRVLAGEVLDGLRRATVRVTLAQNRVNGRALDRVVAGASVAFLVRRRLLGVIREFVSSGLKLLNRRLELGYRR